MSICRSNVHPMPSYWVMPAVALISCIIIGIGFIVGIPGDRDHTDRDHSDKD